MIAGYDINELRAANQELGIIVYITFLFVAFFVMVRARALH
jgi:hypothetical protein